MYSVTSRITAIQQPRGGFIKPSDFDVIALNDGLTLNETENVHASIVGMAVDYLTRFCMGAAPEEAFRISLIGANAAEKRGVRKATKTARSYLNEIHGNDAASIISACKLATFDVWYRNPMAAAMAKGHQDTNPDNATIQNIQILVNRSLAFFGKYGPITKDGFSFEPEGADCSTEPLSYMMTTGQKAYGGYTAVVSSGDGDFLTEDTLWDFKVSKSKPNSKHTLQLLMYWIMGKHSGQSCFHNITRLGIFNPRLNTVYLYEMDKISPDVIHTVENDVICY